jgi:hypothetical protein
MVYTTIEKIITIRGRGCIRPWQPKSIEIDGGDFIALHLRDKFLMRYITGKTFGTSPEGEPIDLVCEWWNKFRGMRNDACIDAVHPQQAGPDGVADVFEAEASKSAKRLKRADVANAPRWVTIHMPEFEAADGTIVPRRDMKVAFEVAVHASVWVEATVENMEYVRLAVLRSIDDDTPCRRRRRGDDRVRTGVKGTYYNYGRNSVFCRYLKNGTPSYCEFAVGDIGNANSAELDVIVRRVAVRLYNHVQAELIVAEGADDDEDVADEFVVLDADVDAA